MKKTALFAIICGTLSIVSCNKPEDNKKPVGPIEIEKEYTELYALGGAVNKWDSMDPAPMTNVGKNLFTIEVDQEQRKQAHQVLHNSRKALE